MLVARFLIMSWAVWLPQNEDPLAGIEGYWRGAMIKAGTVQLIDLDISRTKEGLVMRYQIPDFGIEWYDIGGIETDKNLITFVLGTRYGKLTLIYNSWGDLRGTANGQMGRIDLHLKRSLKPAEIQPTTVDISFSNAGTTLAGELILPPGPGPHPVILYLHGRSQGTRVQLRSQAVVLAARGVGGLVFDRRGEGASGGDKTKVTHADLVADARAALDFLAARAEVDAKHIGLFSHSSGGWPLVAVAAANPTVNFVITNVGSAESVADQQVRFSQALMKRSGVTFTDEDYAAAEAHMRRVLAIAAGADGLDALIADAPALREKNWARFVDIIDDPKSAQFSWLQRFQSDPTADLKRIKVPFLALYGEQDYVVEAQTNSQKLAAALAEAGNHDLKTVIFPHADHGLWVAGAVRNVNGAKLFVWPRLVPGYYETILDWLRPHLLK